VSQQDLYAMEVDCENRNCYNYRRFGHLVRNWEIRDRIGESRRLEYREKESNEERKIIEEENGQNNLNGDKNLIVLNEVLVATTDLQCLIE